MANKEKLEQLTGYINKLTKLTESIYEREIYPVSFFSQAHDVTNRIQEVLHQIEIDQIDLFEHQMKEHQAQIQNVQYLKKKNELSEQSTSLPPSQPASADNITQTGYETHPVSVLVPDVNTEENNQDEQITQQIPVDEKPSPEVEYTDKEKTLSDIRKALRLNDRFRFCRELFSSDESLMNQTFSALNRLDSYNSSMSYIKENFNWNLDDEVVSEFMEIVEKRFEQQY